MWTSTVRRSIGLGDTVSNIPSSDDHIIAGYYNISLAPDDADGERIGHSDTTKQLAIDEPRTPTQAHRFNTHLLPASTKALNTWITIPRTPAVRKARRDRDNDSQIDYILGHIHNDLHITIQNPHFREAHVDRVHVDAAPRSTSSSSS